MSGALPSASSTRRAAGSEEQWLANTAFGRRRAKPDGAEGRHPADEAIHQHGHTLQRTAQKDAAETRDVKPAKLGEDIQRVVRVGLIDRNAPLNGIDLPGKALIRRPAPRPVMHSTGWPSSTAATALEVVVFQCPSRPWPAG